MIWYLEWFNVCMNEVVVLLMMLLVSYILLPHNTPLFQPIQLTDVHMHVPPEQLMSAEFLAQPNAEAQDLSELIVFEYPYDQQEMLAVVLHNGDDSDVNDDDNSNSKTGDNNTDSNNGNNSDSGSSSNSKAKNRRKVVPLSRANSTNLSRNGSFVYSGSVGRKESLLGRLDERARRHTCVIDIEHSDTPRSLGPPALSSPPTSHSSYSSVSTASSSSTYPATPPTVKHLTLPEGVSIPPIMVPLALGFLERTKQAEKPQENDGGSSSINQPLT